MTPNDNILTNYS